MENQNVDPQISVEKESNSALHFFLYLLAFLSLGFVAFGSGDILFEYINKYFPDILSGSYAGAFDQGSVKFGIAALFVSAPVFFYIMNLIAKALREGTMAERSKVRRWLIYIVLFFAAGTIIGDLITLIVYFLDGDIASRFLLKVATVLIIASAIFGYYFWDVRRNDVKDKVYAENKRAFFSSAILILAIFLSGFFIIDSPSVSRDKKQDNQTVSDLQTVDNNINFFYTDSKKLPQSLDELKNTKYESTVNPLAQIEYTKVSDLSYKLCAIFKQSDVSGSNINNSMSIPIIAGQNESWLHEAGKFCFQRTVVE